jgi:hypothetical protein
MGYTKRSISLLLPASAAYGPENDGRIRTSARETPVSRNSAKRLLYRMPCFVQYVARPVSLLLEVPAELSTNLVVPEISLVSRSWVPGRSVVAYGRALDAASTAFESLDWMPLFFKFDLLKEFTEIRGGHVGTAEPRLLGKLKRQAEMDPAEHEGCEELHRFTQLV